MALWTSRNLGLMVLVAGSVALGGLQGCVLERETTLSRVARQREVQAMQVARERLEQEREILTRRTAELQVEIGAARSKTVSAVALRRATLASLQHELRKLVVAEQDLAAAKQRAVAIEQELKPLRDLEKTLQQQEALRAAAEQRVKLLQQEVATAEAAADKVTAELQPKLDALKTQLEQAKAIEKAITESKAAVLAAAKILVPGAKKPEPKPEKD